MAEKYFACDPSVVSVQLFLLADEKYRNGKDADGNQLGGGWQSGLLTAGGQGISQPKSAYAQVASDFAAGRDACSGPMIAWSPKGGSSGGGASGGGGGTGSATSPGNATLGDPEMLFDPSSLAAWQKALDAANSVSLAFNQIHIQSLVIPTQTFLSTLFEPLQPWDGTTLGLSGVLYSCAGTCTSGDLLNLFWSANARSRSLSTARGKVTKVATFASTMSAGRKTSPKVKLALKKSAKTPGGTYFLVAVATDKADPSARYGFGIQLRSAKAKPAKKK